LFVEPNRQNLQRNRSRLTVIWEHLSKQRAFEAVSAKFRGEPPIRLTCFIEKISGFEPMFEAPGTGTGNPAAASSLWFTYLQTSLHRQAMPVSPAGEYRF
jgi:hypothetical protein